MKTMGHSYCNNENKKKKKQPKSNSMIDSLPVEILIDILLRLPVNSVCCIRCVSKALLKTVDDLSFATLHMRRRLLTASCNTTPEVPRLVLLIDSPFMQMHPLKYNGKDLIKSKHAIVSDFRLRQLYCYYPAFVFCNLFGFKDISFHAKYGRSCLLLNPFKGEFLVLPTASDVQISTNSSFVDDWYGMGFDNITNTYKIVRVSCQKEDFKTHMATQVLVLGTSSWRELPSIPPSCLTHKSTYAHGDMHWLVIEDD
ncbi:unnamed protein product, partial [Prunus brigantina]